MATVDVAARDVAARFGQELRNARLAAGLTQKQLADRIGLGQPAISRIERGIAAPDLRMLARLARGAGQQLSVRMFPSDGVRLRDSGQLLLARDIQAEAHPSWKVALEVPVAPPPDRRAADMVLECAAAVLLIEIERAPRDFQAQLRAAQLKRVALSERVGRPVRLLLAMPDTASARRTIAPHAELIRGALPVASRSAWAAIRSGSAAPGDGLLWVRHRSEQAGRR